MIKARMLHNHPTAQLSLLIRFLKLTMPSLYKAIVIWESNRETNLRNCECRMIWKRKFSISGKMKTSNMKNLNLLFSIILFEEKWSLLGQKFKNNLKDKEKTQNSLQSSNQKDKKSHKTFSTRWDLNRNRYN